MVSAQEPSYQTIGSLAMLMALFVFAPAVSAAETKVLLCTGDFGMWAQDRVPMIVNAVEKAAPGKVVWESEQSFNFVKKLEAPGFADRFDVIACGDIAIGQFTIEAQEAIVHFVERGGGFIYVIDAKSGCPLRSSREVVPAPLVAILPYAFPDANPLTGARKDATVFTLDDPFFKGLDFSTTSFMKEADGKAKPVDKIPPAALERAHGKGRVIALYGFFSASYAYKSYATYEHKAGGWDEWPQLGELWSRVVERAAEKSPARAQGRAQLDAAIKRQAVGYEVAVDTSKIIDDIRASDFSIVALQQLYNEDGGANEKLFLDLNPLDWFDRRTQEVLANTAGTKTDKPALFREYHIKGIHMADNSYGSYGKWDDKKYEEQIASAVDIAQKYPDIMEFFQPGNEPPLDPGYFAFHNRIAKGVIAGAPAMKIVGPNRAFNIEGVDDKGMREFIDACGNTTDVLNWHIYAQPPSIVLREALYWSAYAKGKMRSPGPAPVMFTESDAWNTGDSQFNYIMDRAFTFLPEKTIIGAFQYCMDSRFEGGTYHFGVLQPEGEFSANYNGYWVWRNLRGKMVSTAVAVPDAAATGATAHLHAISSISADGKTVTAVIYHDTGWYDGEAKRAATSATVKLTVKLPPGSFSLSRSEVSWNVRKATEVPGVAEKQATVEATLAPCEAVAFTWTSK